MKILISTTFLNTMTGSELFFYDLAVGLQEKNVDVHCWIMHMVPEAPLVKLLRLSNVVFLDSPPSQDYDAIIFQIKETFTFFSTYYQETPKFGICHGPTLPDHIPPKDIQNTTYVAITREGERYLRKSGYKDVCYINYGIDLQRFSHKDRLKQKPGTAMINSKYCDKKLIYKVCEDMAINVLEIGKESWKEGHDVNHYEGVIEVQEEGNVVDHKPDIAAYHIEDYLNQADLVFASGRCAVEALATGRACIVNSYDRLGDGMVTEDNVQELAYYNFSGRCKQIEFTEETLKQEILKYNPSMFEDNYQFAKDHYDLSSSIEKWMGLIEKSVKPGKDKAQRDESNTNNSKLVFIVGVPRSGTTWLWGLLTSHKDVVSLALEDFDPNSPSVVNGKRWTSETHAFLHYDDDTIVKTINKKRKLFPDKVLVDKNPKHILYIKKILHVFPEAKIIHVLRDPRAVVSSMLHSKFFKFADSLEDAVGQYRTGINTISPFLDHDNVYTLKYEDLLTNTKSSLIKVLEFMGISKKYVQEMIEDNYKKVKVDVDGAFRKGREDSYKEDLSEEEIKFVEEELEGLMKDLHYKQSGGENKMLDFTGERYLPWVDDAIINYEHLHRYRFAKEFVKGKKVLDLACGEGYGSCMLSEDAGPVTGIDIDSLSIKHASSTYIKENLEFITGSITDIPIKEEKIFDVIVCFEALEHIEGHDELMKEVKRLIKDDGIFIVSSPNRYTYSDLPDYQNPFHLKELYFDEFKALLNNNFNNTHIYGQKVYPSSNIFPLFRSGGFIQCQAGSDPLYPHSSPAKPFDGLGRAQVDDKGEEAIKPNRVPPAIKQLQKDFVIQKGDKGFHFVPPESKKPRYFIAISSDSPIKEVTGDSYLVDESETLIKQKDAHIGNFEAALRDKDTHVRNFQKTIEERDVHVGILQTEIKEKDAHIIDFQKTIKEAETHIRDLESTIKEGTVHIRDLESTIKEGTVHIGNLESTIRDKDTYLNKQKITIMERDATLDHIYSSHSWKALLIYFKVRNRIFSRNSKMRKVARIVWNLLQGKRVDLTQLDQQESQHIEFSVTKKEEQTDSHNNLLTSEDNDGMACEIKMGQYLLALLVKKQSNNSRKQIKVSIDKPIVIVLPVYNAYDSLRICLESVLKNTDLPARLIVIDDCSTDKRIVEFLEKFTKGKHEHTNIKEMKLLKNESNLGFPKTVNKGFEGIENHVVIINSDIEVPSGWLSRIMKPIIENPERVASVTPFSNSATICSFPEFCQNNSMFKNISVEECDHFFREYGTEDFLEIPTGVGFCMAMNKNTINKIGIFDSESFGTGYAEENDWCMKAFKAGFINVMIQNLFVYHKDATSFSSKGEKSLLMEENLKKLGKKHVEYFPWVDNFISKDSPRPVRDTILAIADAKTKKNEERVVLIITHALGGGVNRYEEDISRVFNENGAKLIVLSYSMDNGGSYIITYRGYTKPIVFRLRENLFEGGAFERLVEIFNIDIVYVNSLVSFPEVTKCLTAIISSGIPYVCAMHDYFSMCISWNLLNDKMKFCGGETDPKVCKSCLEKGISDYKHYYHEHIDIEVWRRGWRKFLGGAFNVLCFSEVSRNLLLKYYPDLQTEVIEHYIPVSIYRKQHLSKKKKPELRINIAVIGAIGLHKGANIVRELVELIRKEELHITVIVVGVMPENKGFYTSIDGILRVTGFYSRGDLFQILSDNKTDIVLIPSIWPETFSYTTSEAMLCGYPVMVFNIGAQADRVKRTGGGVVVDEVSASAVLKYIEELMNNSFKIDELAENAKNYQPIDKEIYKNSITKLLNGITHEKVVNRKD